VISVVNDYFGELMESSKQVTTWNDCDKGTS